MGQYYDMCGFIGVQWDRGSEFWKGWNKDNFCFKELVVLYGHLECWRNILHCYPHTLILAPNLCCILVTLLILLKVFFWHMQDLMARGFQRYYSIIGGIFYNFVVWRSKRNIKNFWFDSCSVAVPDPHGSAFILVSWIRIRIRNTDPDRILEGQNYPQKWRKFKYFCWSLDVLYGGLEIIKLQCLI